ncbi:MAG: tRNA pseudouridine(13) synthase TruD, partial [Acidobacteria bacterium]|nr:tRNA pseudouridine(13) synthase TruD [Acidobacteriota bacterium]
MPGSRSDRPRIRARVEDFEVEEIPLERPEGDGEHLYLWLEKRGLTTTAVARALAERAGVDSGEVGFAGRKDRWAVTRQWFSVPRWPVERAAELASALASGPASELATPGVEILDAVRGRRRLRLGELAGNRFRLRVRGLSPELLAAALAAFETLARRGFANAFGRQRFGSRGDNVDRGLGVLAGDDRTGGRRRRAFLISAVQAEVFNRVLARRPVGWDELMTGDLAVAHGSGRLVAVADPAELAPRLERFAVSATGPIFGAKMPRAGGAVAELEAAVLAELGVGDAEALPAVRELRVAGERRSLRARVRRASAEAEGCDLLLSFDLPPGSYATVLLDH